MASNTKEALGNALKQMLAVKPIERITVKDLVDICSVNRQTFYYHFDDVYDLLEWVFEEDANKVLPSEVSFSHWREDVLLFFKYLYDNSTFALNIYIPRAVHICSAITSGGSRAASGALR